MRLLKYAGFIWAGFWAFSVLYAQDNLVKNGAFKEHPVGKAYPSYWFVHADSLKNAIEPQIEFVSDEHFLRMSKKGGKNLAFTQNIEDRGLGVIRENVGNTYLLTAFAKGTGLDEKGAYATIQLFAVNDGGEKRLALRTQTEVIKGDSDWKKIQVAIKPKDSLKDREKLRSIEVNLVVSSNAGFAEFKDISFGKTEGGAGAGAEYDGVQTGNVLKQAAVPPKLSPVVITLQPDRVIGPLEKDLFGFNMHRWGLERILIDKQSGKIDPEGAALLQGIPFPLVRLEGDGAMRFHWKQMIGPQENRIPFEVNPKKFVKLEIGPVEFEQWIKGIDRNAGTAWLLNLFGDSPEDHADLVQFLTGKPGQAKGKIDWAKRREELGLKEPVKVKIWELGNEVDWDAKEKWTIAKYVEECRKSIKAIRAVDPKAKIAVHALTAAWSPKHQELPEGNWAGWHRILLRELGKDIDYISFHPYYNGLPTSEIEVYLDRIRDDIRKITGENRIRVYISEHARWPERPEVGDWKKNWYLTHCLEGTLCTGQFLVRCMNRPEITAASYHAIASGPWGMLYRDENTGKLYSTGIAELFRLFAKLPEGVVVATAVSGDETDVTQRNLTFCTAAVQNKNELFLIMVNRSGSPRQASLSLPERYQYNGGWSLSGPSVYAVNTVEAKPIKISEWEAVRDKSKWREPTILPLSMSIMKFSKVN